MARKQKCSLWTFFLLNFETLLSKATATTSQQFKRTNSVENVNWPTSTFAIPGKFPDKSEFKNNQISWYTDLPNDYGGYFPRTHQTKITQAAMIPLFLELKEAGYFEQKMIEFPSIYPGFQLSKKMGRKIGKKAFF